AQGIQTAGAVSPNRPRAIEVNCPCLPRFLQAGQVSELTNRDALLRTSGQTDQGIWSIECERTSFPRAISKIQRYSTKPMIAKAMPPMMIPAVSNFARIGIHFAKNPSGPTRASGAVLLENA